MVGGFRERLLHEPREALREGGACRSRALLCLLLGTVEELLGLELLDQGEIRELRGTRAGRVRIGCGFEDGQRIGVVEGFKRFRCSFGSGFLGLAAAGADDRVSADAGSAGAARSRSGRFGRRRLRNFRDFRSLSGIGCGRCGGSLKRFNCFRRLGLHDLLL